MQPPKKGGTGRGLEPVGGIREWVRSGHQPDTTKNGLGRYATKPLNLLVAGVGFEPTTFRL